MKRLSAQTMNVFLILFGTLFLAVGIFTGWLEARVATEWPQIPAESTGSSVFPFRNRGHERFQVRYKLRFTVEGVEYIVPSDPNLTFGNAAAAQQRASP